MFLHLLLISIIINLSSIPFGQICASARDRVQLRARRQKQSPYGPKGKSVGDAVEWQHDFLREKVIMASDVSLLIARLR